MNNEETKEEINQVNNSESSDDFIEVSPKRSGTLTLSLGKKGDVKVENMVVNDHEVKYDENVPEVEIAEDTKASDAAYAIWCEKNKVFLDDPEMRKKFENEMNGNYKEEDEQVLKDYGIID